MEPRRKRPRLSMFTDELPNAELDTARIQNDRHLKGRFEAIFQKYERDFSGVGDEVDLSTGEIIVNNGHLAGLTEEVDTRSEADESKGEPSTAESKPSPGRRRLLTDGRSMLRAMTVAPDRENAYFENENADDVIESIEAIAERAALVEQDGVNSGQSDDGESDEADNDEASAVGTPSDEPTPIPVLADNPVHEAEQEVPDSDDDSLFDVPDGRESSPDSLFEQPTAASSATPHEEINPTSQFFDSLGDLDEKAILARFGDEIGKEVLSLIEKRDKAELHIEAAWRIPIQLEQEEPPSHSPAIDSEREQSATSTSTSSRTPSHGAFLWGVGAHKRSRLELHQDRTMRVIRAESEDPLQEGFGESGQVQVRVAEVSLDRATRLLNRGMCPYCKEEFFNLPAAKNHLDAVLEILKAGSSGDSTHSADRIEGLLSAVKQAEEVDDDAAAVSDDDNVLESVEAEVPGNGKSSADFAGDDGSESTPRGDRDRDTKSDTDESEDDLFVDAGYVHSDGGDLLDADDALDLTERPAGTLAKPTQAAAASRSMMTSEIQDSVTEPVVSPSLLRGPSGRRRRRRASSHEDSAEATLSHSTAVDELVDYPEFQETSDPFDRTGSRNYRGRPPETLPPQLSIRPRRAKRNVSYALPKPRPPAARRKQATRPAKRKETKVSKGKPAPDAITRALVRPPVAAESAELADDDDNAGDILDDPIGANVNVVDDSENNASHDSADEAWDDDLDDINAAFEPIRPKVNEVHSGGPVETDSEEADDYSSDYGLSPEPVYHFTVSDFKCLVVHHEVEGAGLEPFGEIMTNHYYNYRLPVDPLLGSEIQSEWTKSEELLLQGLSLNPETLMETIKRRLPGRSQFDIGNRLADRWIAEARLPAQSVPEPLEEPYLAAFRRGALKQRNATDSLLDFPGADTATDNDDDRGRKRPRMEPLKRRICRTQSPGGTWLGCGRVYSQRSAVYRHWKDTNRACLVPGYMARQKPDQKKRVRATKENGLPCRSTSPGGTVRGCHKMFRQRSTLFRHWRTNGVKCRPAGYQISDLNSSDVEEVAESDHGQGDALDSPTDAVHSSASPEH